MVFTVSAMACCSAGVGRVFRSCGSSGSTPLWGTVSMPPGIIGPVAAIGTIGRCGADLRGLTTMAPVSEPSLHGPPVEPLPVGTRG